MLFASLLTTREYLYVSEGKYSSHEEIEFDHKYVSDRVMGYLNYRYDDLLIGKDAESTEVIFSQTEIRHMKDVKNLYTSLRIVALLSLIIAVSLMVVVYKKDKNQLFEVLKFIYVGPIIFIIMLGVGMAIDFQGIFTIFHQLFFTNDDWILYSTDPLIQLLPTNFWMVSAFIILVLFGLTLGLISYLSNRFMKKQVT